MTMRNRQVQSLLLAIILAAGAGVAWGVAVVWGGSVIGDMVTPHQMSEQIIFRRDGTPLVESYTSSDYSARRYRTLDGKPVKLASDQLTYAASLPAPEPPDDWFTMLPWDSRVQYVYTDYRDVEIWYCIHDGQLDGHAYLVGYDKATKLRIGYIGRDGFRDDKPPLDDQFAVNGRHYLRAQAALRYGTLNVRLLRTDEGIIRIDINARKATLLWKNETPFSFATTAILGTTDDAKPHAPIILIREFEQVRVIDPDGKELESYPIPNELRDVPWLQWLQLPGGKAVAYHSPFFGLHDLYWIDAKGSVRRQQVNLHFVPPTSKPMAAVMASVVAPVPVGVAGVMALLPCLAREYSKAGSYTAGFCNVLADFWPGLLIATCVGTVLAVFCYRRQRKYGLPWTGVWTTFVLLFGLPAYFGYLAHRSWPARLPCPNCGQPAPRDRPTCLACGSDFPAPPPKGIEVFA